VQRRLELRHPAHDLRLVVERGLAEQELQLRAERDERLDEVGEDGEGVGVLRRERGGDRAFAPVERVVRDGDEQVLAGRVVLVERGPSDAGRLGDVGEGRVRPRDQHLGGDVEQLPRRRSGRATTGANIHVHYGT
jgi:hypothetical protein